MSNTISSITPVVDIADTRSSTAWDHFTPIDHEVSRAVELGETIWHEEVEEDQPGPDGPLLLQRQYFVALPEGHVFGRTEDVMVWGRVPLRPAPGAARSLGRAARDPSCRVVRPEARTGRWHLVGGGRAPLPRPRRRHRMARAASHAGCRILSGGARDHPRTLQRPAPRPGAVDHAVPPFDRHLDPRTRARGSAGGPRAARHLSLTAQQKGGPRRPGQCGPGGSPTTREL